MSGIEILHLYIFNFFLFIFVMEGNLLYQNPLIIDFNLTPETSIEEELIVYFSDQ